MTADVTIPVQWGDMDALGHMNNAVFLRWFESGRIAWFGEAGFSVAAGAEAVVPVLVSVTVNFRKQVTFPATVEISTRLASVGRTSLTMEHRARLVGEAGEVADATSVVVLFDTVALRPSPVPEDLRRLMRPEKTR